MLRAVRVRLYPTTKQKILLSQHFGATRFIYNYMLNKKIEDYKNDVKTSAYDLKKLLPIMKKEENYSWLKNIDSQALGEAILNMDKAYKNFFKNGFGFPKFKSRKNLKQSFQYPQRVKINDDKNRLYLPKIGWVKAKIHRDITCVKTVTISLEANEYYASVLTELKDIENTNLNNTVGIDMGVKKFATLSNGTYIKPIDFSGDLKKLKRLQKVLSRKQHSRKKGDATPQSNNYKKQKLKVQKQNLKIARRRNDFLHKASTIIAKENKVVIIEDLKIINMTKSSKGNSENHGKKVKQKSGLNRAILQQSWGMFFNMLEYKLKDRGGELVKVDPRETSRTCTRCGNIDKDNRESQSVFKCTACGFSLNADYNASIVIANRWTNGDCLSKSKYELTEQEALAL